jgi:hypothetical protein
VVLEFPYPDAERELSRWLPLVKWLLAIPHYVVLVLLYVGSLFVVIVAWFAILFTGRFPRAVRLPRWRRTLDEPGTRIRHRARDRPLPAFHAEPLTLGRAALPNDGREPDATAALVGSSWLPSWPPRPRERVVKPACRRPLRGVSRPGPRAL